MCTNHNNSNNNNNNLHGYDHKHYYYICTNYHHCNQPNDGCRVKGQAA